MTTTAAVPMSERAVKQTVRLVLLTSFVIFADVAVLLLAAPIMQRDLHAGVADIELMVAAYQIGYAGTLITGGRLGDILGRRTMFTLAYAAFGTTSIACGLAQSAGWLIGFRAAQGIAAAMLSPQVLATIQLVLPPERRVGAFAAQGAALSLATVAGPLVGALIVSANPFGAGWRAIFLVNVPIATVAILCRRLIPAYRSPTAKRLDLGGAALAVLALTAIMASLSLGPLTHWAWLLLATVPPLAIAFLVRQRGLDRAGLDPLLPPGLWRDRAFRTGLVLYLVLYAGFSAFFLYYSIVLQTGYRLAPVPAALGLVPGGLATMAVSPLSGRLSRKFGARRLLTAGCLTCSAGFLTLLAPLSIVDNKALAIWTAPSLLVIGGGFGLVFAPLLSVVVYGIRGSEAGAASGLLSTAQLIGGALGVGLMGILFQAALPGTIDTATAAQLATGLRYALLLTATGFLLSPLLIAALPRAKPTERTT
jgi:MFS family permease